MASPGNAYGELGDYQKKKELLERALSINVKHYGPDHREVAIPMADLGNAYGDLGNHQMQKELLERALKIQEKHYGLDYHDVAVTLGYLGSAYGSLGDYKQKKELLKRALLIEEKHYGPDHKELAITLTNLGNAYGDLGNHQKQKKLLERALQITQKHYGPDHKEVAIPMASLGIAYGELGDYQTKKQLLEQALLIEEKHYGPDHKELAITLTNLGNAYGDLDNYQVKKELLERALLIKEKYYGPDHKEVAITLTNLGNAYGDLGNHQKQREQLERALQITEKHYGPDHKEVAIPMASLGIAYGELGDYQKRKELLERALKIQEKHHGLDHNDVAVTLGYLGSAYGSLGDYKQKKELLKRALLIEEKYYGPDHKELAITLTNLGNTYGDLGNHQKQKKLLERALQITEKHYGPDHKEVAIPMASLGIAYGDLGDYQTKKQLLEQALLIDEKHYGPDHKELAITLRNLGNAYGDLGNYQKQKKLLERALLIEEKHYGPDHKEVAITLTNLGNAYGDLGNYQMKKELLERALQINEKHYGPDHKTVAVVTNLCSTYSKLSDSEKETECVEKVFRKRKMIQEKDDGPGYKRVSHSAADIDSPLCNFEFEKPGRTEKPLEIVAEEETLNWSNESSTGSKNAVSRSGESVTTSRTGYDLFWLRSTVLMERRESRHLLRYDTGLLALINHPNLQVNLKGVITTNAFLNFYALHQGEECRLHVLVDPHDARSSVETKLTDWFSHEGYTFTCAFQNCTFVQLNESVVRNLEQKNFVFHDISQSSKCYKFMFERERHDCTAIQYDVSDEAGASNVKCVHGIITGVFGIKVQYSLQYAKATNRRIACPILQVVDCDRSIIIALHTAQSTTEHNSLIQNGSSTIFEGSLMKYVYVAICEDFHACRLAEVRALRTADGDEVGGIVRNRLLPDLTRYFQPESAFVQDNARNVIEMQFKTNKLFIQVTHYHMFCSFMCINQLFKTLFKKDIWYPVCRDSKPWSADMRQTDWTLERSAQLAIEYLSACGRRYLASPTIPSAMVNTAVNRIEAGYNQVSAGNRRPPSENSMKKVREALQSCTCTIQDSTFTATAMLAELVLDNHRLCGLMTNQHVLTESIIRSNNTFRLDFKGLKTRQIFKFSNANRGTYIFCSHHLDCTFIELKMEFVDYLKTAGCTFSHIDDATPRMFGPESFITTSHFPEGGEFTFSYGHVKSIPHSCGFRIQHDADTLSGSSGAPVVNEEARIIGIHCGGLQSPERIMNHFIHMDSIITAIKKDLSISEIGERKFPRVLSKLHRDLKDLFLKIFDKDDKGKVTRSHRDRDLFHFTTQDPGQRERIWCARTAYGWFVCYTNEKLFDFGIPQKTSNWHYLDHAAQKIILDQATSPVVEDVLQYLIDTDKFYIIDKTLHNDNWS